MEKNKKVNCLFLNPAPSLIKYGMYWGMGKIGCNTYLFDYGETALFDKPQEYQLKKIEEKIIEQKTNILFCEGYGGLPIKGVSELCKKYGIQYHYWDIESPVTPLIALNMLPYCDFVWSTCIEYVYEFRDMGYKSDLLLFGCNNDFHQPLAAEDRFKHDLSIVGSNYSNRYNKVKDFIMPLFDKFDIKAYGYWWMDKARPINLSQYPDKYWSEHPAIPYEWLGIVIASSKVMIGLNCSDESRTQTSCRPFETLAWSDSAVYLAWYTKAQDKLFGKYIYQAKTGQEMIDMANEILAMTDEQRKEIAKRGRDYVHLEHNYTIRAQKVVDKFFELGGI
jgi:spore maturation protein CgeB